MSQVVEPDAWQVAALDDAVEELAERFGVKGLAVGVDEDRVAGSGGDVVVVESPPPGVEVGFGGGVEIDAASTGSGFGGELGGSPADDLAGAADGEVVEVGVPVAPAESGEFAASHAGGGGEVEGGVKALARCVVEEVGELVAGPGGWPGSGEPVGAWWSGVEGGVGVGESDAGGFGECGADDHVNLVDGLGCEAGVVAAAAVGEVVVEVVEVVGAEAAQWEMAEGGVDVVVDHPGVAVGGGWSCLLSASGEPGVGEVLGEGDVVAAGSGE